MTSKKDALAELEAEVAKLEDRNIRLATQVGEQVGEIHRLKQKVAELQGRNRVLSGPDTLRVERIAELDVVLEEKRLYIGRMQQRNDATIDYSKELEQKVADAEKDTLRMEFAYWYVRNRLESDGLFEAIALLVGDAPADCNCREAICPHTPIGPSLDGIRDALDAARDSHPQETLRDVLSAAREAQDD